MGIGVLLLLAAIAGAAWQLRRLSRQNNRNNSPKGRDRLIKAIAWFGLAAALFTAKLWPLALMTLIAAGGVAAIEAWRDQAVARDNGAAPTPTTTGAMDANEAAAILGVGEDADAAAIKAAHRRLISQIHPDHGGTDYLAAKINEARDLLLSKKS